MPKTVTVTLSDIEYKAMSIISYSVEEWIENVVKVRAQTAITEIAQDQVEQALEKGMTIQGTKEEIVANADIPTAKEVTDANDNMDAPK